MSGPPLFGWGTRIRTSAYGSRVRCPTARRSPNFKIYFITNSLYWQIYSGVGFRSEILV